MSGLADADQQAGVAVMARLERVASGQAARAVFQLLRGDHVDHIGSPNRKRGEAEAPPLSSSARGNRAAPIARSQVGDSRRKRARTEEHTSELQSLLRNTYAVFCLTKQH